MELKQPTKNILLFCKNCAPHFEIEISRFIAASKSMAPFAGKMGGQKRRQISLRTFFVADASETSIDATMISESS